MEFLEILKSILFGIVEGITEWLPISSTGHMILLEQLVPIKLSAKFMELFLVVIQLGAIMAVVVLYFHRLNPFSAKKSAAEKKDTFSLWKKVIVACLPLVPLVPFQKKIDEIFYNYKTVAVTLILYGILFILVENRNKHRVPKATSIAEIDYRSALIIGLFQALALIPGTSRSGATILGALLIGISRSSAAEFTFFLAIPTMFGASLVKLWNFGLHYTALEATVLLVAVVTAFLVSVLAIRFLMNYIKKHDFKPFGWYRIALGVAVLAYFMLTHA